MVPRHDDAGAKLVAERISSHGIILHTFDAARNRLSGGRDVRCDRRNLCLRLDRLDRLDRLQRLHRDH